MFPASATSTARWRRSRRPPRHGQFELRVMVKVRSFGQSPDRRTGAARAPTRPCAAAGRPHRDGGGGEGPATAQGRLRRTRLARAAGDARGPARSRWQQLGRRGGIGGVADRLARIRQRGDRTRARRGARRRDRRGRARRGRRAVAEPAGRVPAVRALPPARRFRAERRDHRGGAILLLAALAGIPRWLGEVCVLGAIGSYVLAVGLQPSVVRAGIAGALASLAWLASRPRDRWYFLLVAAIVAPRMESVQPARARLPALVRGRVRDLRARSADRAAARGLSACRACSLLPIAVSAACGLCTAPLLWLDFGALPSTPCRRMRWPSRRCHSCSALGLISAVVHPILPAIAEALAWLNGWFAAYLAWCARFVGGLPTLRCRRSGLCCSSPTAQDFSPGSQSGCSRPACGASASSVARAWPSAWPGACSDEPGTILGWPWPPSSSPSTSCPATDRPKIEEALRRLRSRVGEGGAEILSAAETSGEDAVATCNAPGLFAVGGRARGRPARRELEGGGREGHRGVPRRPGPRDRARAGRLGDQEGLRRSRRPARRRASSCSTTSPSRSCPNWVAERFRALGANADREACRLLVELVGDNVTELETEIEKLVTWADGETVDATAVRGLAAGRAEIPIFA